MTLEQQYETIRDDKPYYQLYKILEHLGFEERGGGPEGVYYTHAKLDGQFLLRSMPDAVKKLLTL